MVRRRFFLNTVLLLLLLPAAPLFAQLAAIESFAAPSIDEPGEISVRFIIPDGHYQAHDPEFFGFRLASEDPLRLGEIRYPEPDEIAEGLEKYRGEVILTAPVYIDSEASGVGQEVIAFHQICQDDGLCLFPEEEELSLASAADSPPTPENGDGTGLSRVLLFALLAFLGGLLLNVMPCVLPVLSIKALNLLRQSNEERSTIRKHAVVFGSGVVLSLMLLGLFVVALKSAGQAVGWGFQFQNPYYVFSLIAILVVFALSLFDVWIFTFTGGRRVAGAAAKQGYGGSFAGGVFTVLLATPCTAPFLGTALGFAFSQSAGVILLIFFFVGLGLALPFTLLGFFPGLIQRLPKPGPWMERFKEAMGLLLLATAAWLFGVLIKQLGNAAVTPALLLLTAIAAAAWLWGKFGQQARKRITRISFASIALLMVLASLVALPLPAGDQPEGGESRVAENQIPEGWQEFAPEAVRQAREAGKPVFVQFSADWCLTCKTNELTVFSREEVDRRFEELGVIRFYGDFTENDPQIAAWIADFGKAGVPVYALYPPGRERPVLLPELLTPSLLINTLTNNLAW